MEATTKISIRKGQMVILDAEGFAWPLPPYDIGQCREIADLRCYIPKQVLDGYYASHANV